MNTSATLVRSRRRARNTSPDQGALGGLEALTSNHLVRFKAAVEAGGQTGWAYYLPYLLASEKPGRRSMLLREEQGSICVFRLDAKGRSARLDLMLPPIPMETTALNRALERANEFNGDRSARILRVDSKDADAVASIRSLRVRPRRAQYLFEPARYESIAGGSFHTIRRNTKLFEDRADVEVARFEPRHVYGCRALLKEWRERHRREQGTGGGVGFTGRVLDLAGTLPEQDLAGQVVLIDGRVVGFAFGGMIRPGLGCSLERKCDAAIRGLSYFQFRSFLLSLRDYERVNDGSDAKRVGLRQFKDSFRPLGMLMESRASQAWTY
jgi:hypothetical protein